MRDALQCGAKASVSPPARAALARCSDPLGRPGSNRILLQTLARTARIATRESGWRVEFNRLPGRIPCRVERINAGSECMNAGRLAGRTGRIPESFNAQATALQCRKRLAGRIPHSMRAPPPASMREGWRVESLSIFNLHGGSNSIGSRVESPCQQVSWHIARDQGRLGRG